MNIVLNLVKFLNRKLEKDVEKSLEIRKQIQKSAIETVKRHMITALCIAQENGLCFDESKICSSAISSLNVTFYKDDLGNYASVEIKASKYPKEVPERIFRLTFDNGVKELNEFKKQNNFYQVNQK